MPNTAKTAPAFIADLIATGQVSRSLRDQFDHSARSERAIAEGIELLEWERCRIARRSSDTRHPGLSNSESEAAMQDLTDNGDRLRNDVDVMKRDISNLADQLTDALDTLAGSAQKQARLGAKQVRSSADSVVSDLGKHGSAALEQARDAAATLGDTLEDAVQKRPLATVGLAVGLGLLIGMTWRR